MDQIVELIRQATVPDNAIQKQVFQEVQRLSQCPDFLLSLAYIMNSTMDVDIRFKAGIMLKSALRSATTIQPELEQYFLVAHENPLIRQAYTIVVPEFVTRIGFGKCITLFGYLLQMIDTDPELATDCLSKVIEDLKFNTDNINFYNTNSGLELMDTLISRFFGLVSHPNPKVVVNSLNFLNFNVFFMPPTLAQNIVHYVDLLIQAAQSQNNAIRFKGFQGLQALIETKRDRITKIETIILLCVNSISDQDKQIAKYATLFLTDFLRIEDDSDMYQVQLVKGYIQQILCYGIPNFEITKDDQVNIQSSFFDDYQAQKEDNDEDQVIGEYTLRQVTGQLFDKIALYFSSEMTPILIQLIKELLDRQQDNYREIALLLLGQFSSNFIDNHPNEIPQILNILSDPQNQVTQYCHATSFSSLSSYNEWITQNMDKTALERYLQLILSGVQNQSKIVKEASCSAVDVLAKSDVQVIQPYIKDILRVFINCLQEKGMQLYIYQSITTLLEEYDQITDQELSNMLFTGLLGSIANPGIYNVCPQYESIGLSISRCKELALPFIQQIFAHCRASVVNYMNIIESGNTRNLYQQKEILKRALEVCSQIISVVHDQFVQLADPQFMRIIHVALNDSETDVKQYSLSFIGELIKETNLLQNEDLSFINEHIYIQDPDPEKMYLATSNNAAWAIGEVAMKYPQKLLTIYGVLVTKLITIINKPKLEKVYAQNFAIVLIRVISIDLSLSKPYLDQFFKKVALIFSQSKGELFKEFKIFGFNILTQLVQLYPNELYSLMKYYIYAFIVAEVPAKDDFIRIVNEFKQSIGQAAFESLISSQEFPAGFRSKLQCEYNL